jgi:hypothetical protein
MEGLIAISLRSSTIPGVLNLREMLAQCVQVQALATY